MKEARVEMWRAWNCDDEEGRKKGGKERGKERERGELERGRGWK